MTNPSLDEPMLRMTYQPGKRLGLLAGHSEMLERYLKVVLITLADVKTLRALADRNILVQLECPGYPGYQGRVQQILKRLAPVPAAEFWYLPTTKTGPLRETGSAV